MKLWAKPKLTFFEAYSVIFKFHLAKAALLPEHMAFYLSSGSQTQKDLGILYFGEGECKEGLWFQWNIKPTQLYFKTGQTTHFELAEVNKEMEWC